MSYSSLLDCTVKFFALHFAYGLFALTIGIGTSLLLQSRRQTDNSRFVHCPAFEMREFKASGDFVGASLGQQTHFWPRRLRLYDHSQNHCD